MNKYALHQSLHRAPLAAAIGSLLAGGAAHAATITVNTAADGKVGSMPGVCTLRSAIHAANVGTGGVDNCDPGSAGADEIVFAPGLASSTITLSEGEMEISGALTITGPGPDDPSGMTIDGDDASRIFRIAGGESGGFEIELYALTLTGGRSHASGGAVTAIDVNLMLDHVVVTDSQSEYSGGGLHVSGGDVMLVSSTISQNSASGPGVLGGGYYFVNSGGGLSVFGNEVVVSNSTISENSVSDKLNGGKGGGLYVSNAEVTLSQSTVASNTADTSVGAGIRLVGSSSALTLNNSLLVQANADQIACNRAADKHLNTLATDSSCTGTATWPNLIALKPLTDNGGTTRTHALNAGSVAIDAAGDCETDFNITTDQRGAERPIDGDGSGTVECDIGAYEFQDMLFRDRFEQL